jgi:hypothetical protein
MNQDTPAVDIREKDLAKNAEAFRECLAYVPPSEIERALDIRYGLGGWAKAVRERFPDAYITGYEQDPETAEIAWRGSQVRIINESFHPARVHSQFDLLCADFNTLTVLKRKPLDEAVEAAEPAYVVFTDVACCKLHLNFRSYGLVEPDLDAYWRAFPLKGYRLLGYAKRHHAASTAVYKKNAPAG